MPISCHVCNNPSAGRLDQLLDAGDWPAAHTLLCDLVAPRWVLAGALRGFLGLCLECLASSGLG